jgi:hypothetical protein
MTMNKNMLSPVGFSFHVKKLPELNFFVQSVTVPGVTLPIFEQPNPFKAIPRIGDHLQYGELLVNFKVNEDMGNYVQIYNWLLGIGFPDSFAQYKEVAEEAKQLTGDGIESDAYMMVMSSAMNPIMRIDFEDVFPTALGDITMDSRDTGIEYLDTTATFKFLKYTFTPV